MKENDPVKYHAEEILTASQRAAELTKSLLAFSRKQTVHLAVIDLNKVIREFENFIRRLIRESMVTTSDRPNSPTPQATPMAVERVAFAAFDGVIRPRHRHGRACPGHLDAHGTAMPINSGWPGQARPRR